MVKQSEKIVSSAATISPFQWSSSTRHGVDVARQAVAGSGCMAALDAEKWLLDKK